jgi:hypothetical protein
MVKEGGFGYRSSCFTTLVMNFTTSGLRRVKKMSIVHAEHTVNMN